MEPAAVDYYRSTKNELKRHRRQLFCKPPKRGTQKRAIEIQSIAGEAMVNLDVEKKTNAMKLAFWYQDAERLKLSDQIPK